MVHSSLITSKKNNAMFLTAMEKAFKDEKETIIFMAKKVVNCKKQDRRYLVKCITKRYNANSEFIWGKVKEISRPMVENYIKSIPKNVGLSDETKEQFVKVFYNEIESFVFQFIKNLSYDYIYKI